MDWAERRERWYRVTDYSGLFPTAKPSSTPSLWALGDPRHFTTPSFTKKGWEEEWVRSCTRRYPHTEKSSRNETWIDTRLHSPSYFKTVYISGSRLCELCRWWTADHEREPAVCVYLGVCVWVCSTYKLMQKQLRKKALLRLISIESTLTHS